MATPDIITAPESAEYFTDVNTGPDDLVFLCICTPRFRWENYRALE